MSCIQKHTQTLRARGFRMTPQRVTVLDALHAGGHQSPAQIYARIRASGTTEATVYRTLEFLRANGIVYAAQNPDGHLTYELAGHDHHHLRCRACGAQLDLAPELLDDTLRGLEVRTGYRLQDGHLTLFGTCPRCQKDQAEVTR